MVQAAHAALEAGIAFPFKTPEPSSLIMIGVKDQKELESARVYVESCAIDAVMFFEPGWDYGNTAFATRPVIQSERQFLKGFQLWKP